MDNGLMEKLRQLTNYEVEVLPNGAKLITHHRPQSIGVAIAVKFGYGTAYESPEQMQAAHFAEHLMFRKGSKAVYRRRMEELKRLSGQMPQAETEFENIALGSGGGFVILPKHVVPLIRLIGESVYDECIEEESIEEERKIVLEEQLPKAQSEQAKTSRRIWEKVWGADHPYSRSSDPALENIRRMAISDVSAVTHFLGGKYCVVTIVGGYDTDAVCAAREVFGAYPASAKRGDIPLPRAPESQSLWQRARDAQEAQAHIIYRTPPINDEKSIIMNFLLLYFNDPAILWRKLRDETSLAYGLGAWNHSYTQGSIFSLSATNFQEDNAEKVLKTLEGEAKKLRVGEVDSAVFKRVHVNLEAACLDYDRIGFSVKTFSDIELFGMMRPLPHIMRMMEMKGADIKRFAEAYFRDPVRSIVLPDHQR